jgi:hypothetical protein
MPPKKRGTNLSANAERSKSTEGPETLSQEETVSNPTADTVDTVVQPPLLVTELTVNNAVNSVEPIQSTVETVQNPLNGDDPMEVDPPEIITVSSASPAIVMPTDPASLKIMNSPPYTYLLQIMARISDNLDRMATKWDKGPGNEVSKPQELTPSVSKARVTAQQLKDAEQLLKSVKPLCMDKSESRQVKVQKWVKYRASLFARLKEVGLSGSHAATVLKSFLPDFIISELGFTDEFTDPHDLAKSVDEVIMGDPEITLVTTEGLVTLLHYKAPTANDALKSLKLWRASEPYHDDADAIWCKYALFLLPETARNKISEWPEYRANNYNGVWNRLYKKISAVVTPAEYAVFFREHRPSSVTNSEDSSSRKRRRSTEVNDTPRPVDSRAQAVNQNRRYFKRGDRKFQNRVKDFSSKENNRDSSKNQGRFYCDYDRNVETFIIKTFAAIKDLSGE